MLDWASTSEQTVAVRLLDAAERTGSGRPSAGLAKARWARAGVLAHAGHDQEVGRVLDTLDEVFSTLPAEVTAAPGELFWGWGEEGHRYGTTFLRAGLGDPAATERMSQRPEDYRSGQRWQTEVVLQAARGMVRVGEHRHGVDAALTAYHALPAPQRSATITVLARRVATALPAPERTRPAARELLALT